MAGKTFNLKIQGYWRDKNIVCLPKLPGIYFVYEAAYDRDTDSLSFKKLIYIGEADNINKSILKHDKYSDWIEKIGYGGELCYSISQIEKASRERIKAAYIYEHKPPTNKEYKNNFPFNKTHVRSSGETELLNTDFIAFKTFDFISRIK